MTKVFLNPGTPAVTRVVVDKPATPPTVTLELSMADAAWVCGVLGATTSNGTSFAVFDALADVVEGAAREVGVDRPGLDHIALDDSALRRASDAFGRLFNTAPEEPTK